MDCKKVIRSLVPFLEGELSGKLKEEIESHLETCVGCRKERDELSAAWQMLGAYGTPALRDDFVPSLMEKIHSEDAKMVRVVYRLPRFILRPLVPVLASVVVAVIVYTLFWEKPVHEKMPAQEKVLVQAMAPGKAAPSATAESTGAMSDREVIQYLDVLEDADLLKNITVVKDLDVVESVDDATS